MSSKTWMETWSGKRVDLLNPDPSQIDIRDIAHHLSILNRFTGATKVPYSVAQHSLYVSMLVPEHLQLHALLHDAHEAYTNDISTPLKECLYEEFCGRFASPLDSMIHSLDGVIGVAFGLGPLSGIWINEIKRADMQAMSDEKAFLKPNSTSNWEEYGLPPPAGKIDVVMTWREAKQAFLDRFWRLYERTPSVQSHS